MLRIPKLVIPLDLGGYSPELAGESIQVWVDPPRRLRQAYDNLLVDVQQIEIQRAASATPDAAATPQSDAAQDRFAGFLKNAQALLNLRKKTIARGARTDTRILEWYLEIWSQGSQPFTLAELERIEDENPAFLGWMIGETWRMIQENQARLKKN